MTELTITIEFSRWTWRPRTQVSRPCIYAVLFSTDEVQKLVFHVCTTLLL